MSETIHDLIKRDMDRAVLQMHAVIAQEMFRSDTPPRPVPVLTHRERWIRRWSRVTGYLTTVWCALRGDDLVDRSDVEWW